MAWLFNTHVIMHTVLHVICVNQWHMTKTHDNMPTTYTQTHTYTMHAWLGCISNTSTFSTDTHHVSICSHIPRYIDNAHMYTKYVHYDTCTHAQLTQHYFSIQLSVWLTCSCSLLIDMQLSIWIRCSCYVWLICSWYVDWYKLLCELRCSCL